MLKLRSTSVDIAADDDDVDEEEEEEEELLLLLLLVGPLWLTWYGVGVVGVVHWRGGRATVRPLPFPRQAEAGRSRLICDGCAEPEKEKF